MSVPKLCGIETEYGIFIQGATSSNPFVASRLVLGQCEEAGALLKRQQLKEARLQQMSRQYQQMSRDWQDVRASDTGIPDVEILGGGETGYPATTYYGSTYATGSSYGATYAGEPAQGDYQPLSEETYMAAYGWDYSSLMLPNGSRFYIDHAHPEYCTAEARLPRQIVAADKAGELIVERCRQRANQRGNLAEGQEIAIYKNNSDHKGNSYGCHENYLLSAGLYEDLIKRKMHRTLRALVPFLISRAIYIGAGKVGSENELSAAGYQLTQRADFFETIMGLQTTHNRPLINTRDESHASKDDYRRLHVILGDANMAETSTYLKIGTTQLVLMMLEDNALPLNFTLDDPIEAYQIISRDLTFTQPLLLDAGGSITALEMQRQYLSAAQTYLSTKVGELDDTTLAAFREVCAAWGDTLDKIGRDWRLLSKRLDWAIKRNLLERYLTGQNTSWDAVIEWELPLELTMDIQRGPGDSLDDLQRALKRLPGVRGQYVERYLQRHQLDLRQYWAQREIYFTLRRLDLEYHDIRRGADARSTGIFYRLQASGAVERMVTDAEIDHYVQFPPEDTRAYLRGEMIRRYGEHISHADWSELAFREAYAARDTYLVMPDPMALGRAEVADLLEGEQDLQSLLYALRGLVRGTDKR